MNIIIENKCINKLENDTGRDIIYLADFEIELTCNLKSKFSLKKTIRKVFLENEYYCEIDDYQKNTYELKNLLIKCKIKENETIKIKKIILKRKCGCVSN